MLRNFDISSSRCCDSCGDCLTTKYLAENGFYSFHNWFDDTTHSTFQLVPSINIG